MMHQFHDDIRRMGVDPKQYFEAIKITEEEITKVWREDAISRVKMNFILPAIAKAEKITAEKEAIEHELKHLKEHEPKIKEESAKLYIETALVNEEVFKFLEKQK